MKFALAAVVVAAMTPQAGNPRAAGRTDPELRVETFQQVYQQIRPQAGESRWMDVPWFTDLHEARRKAAMEGKPLFIYSSGGAISIGAC